MSAYPVAAETIFAYVILTFSLICKYLVAESHMIIDQIGTTRDNDISFSAVGATEWPSRLPPEDPALL